MAIAERVKEHITVMKNRKPTKSTIAEHALDALINRWIEFHDKQVTSTKHYFYSRVLREAIEITKHRTFSRKDGFKLSTALNIVLAVLVASCAVE